jgi:hypothetical protein
VLLKVIPLKNYYKIFMMQLKDVYPLIFKEM